MSTFFDAIMPGVATLLLDSLGIGLDASYCIPAPGGTFNPADRGITGAGAPERYPVKASPPLDLNIQKPPIAGSLPPGAEKAGCYVFVTPPALPSNRRLGANHLVEYTDSGVTYRVVAVSPMVSGTETAAVVLYLAGRPGVPA